MISANNPHIVQRSTILLFFFPLVIYFFQGQQHAILFQRPNHTGRFSVTHPAPAVLSFVLAVYLPEGYQGL